MIARAHPDRALIAVAEHEAILHALENHDGDAAESYARRHMKEALDVRVLMETAQADSNRSPESADQDHRG